jgi:hypothetical protein
MSTMTVPVDVGGRVRAELEVRTGTPTSELGGEVSLADIGLDSLALIEILLSLREQLLADRGMSTDDGDDPDTLPWLETVDELIDFASTFAAGTEPAVEGL